MRLQGLEAGRVDAWPSPCRDGKWVLFLNGKLRAQHYTGGEFFIYYPASGGFGSLLAEGDIDAPTASSPEGVVFGASTDERVEVRYGNPNKPGAARIVAAATPARTN
ncbi:hypothetical protein ACWF95_38030 [Streptomyces vinaceus]